MYYTQNDARHLPVIVFIQGSHWSRGSLVQWETWAQTLHQAGYVVVIPQLRHLPHHKLNKMTFDVVKAAQWVYMHVEYVFFKFLQKRNYGGDPSQIYLMGHESGAHLALLALLKSTRVLQKYTETLQESIGQMVQRGTLPPIYGLVL